MNTTETISRRTQGPTRRLDENYFVSPHPDPLPRGEGTACAHLDFTHDHPANSVTRFFEKLTAIPPLPRGEGRGEGQRDKRATRLAHDIWRETKTLFYLLTLAAGTALMPINLMAEDMKTNSVEVKIDNFSFSPPTVTVHVGTRVTWMNKDDIPHTVTSDNKLFASRALDTDQNFSFTFTEPGTNNYFCSMHPKMTGKVIVK